MIRYGEYELPRHPRIILLKGDEKNLMKSMRADSVWTGVHQVILDESDSLLAKPLLERIQTGRRLLSISRECLRRVYYLSYAYRTTGNKVYLQRTEQEMLTVASFTDWNPSHFLDVAEMTAALAIGYDWLFHDLKESSREIIRTAIITKGLEPSLITENSGWLKAAHNWNQVCNAGMTLGALAVYEDQPELARQIIDRAVESIVLPMKEYSPDGAYPEGYSYWGYGTGFNVLFLSAIENAFGDDFGLTAIPGFMKTAGYLKNMTGPTGKPFNYSDCGSGGSLNPAMFWFAKKLNDPSLLQNEIAYFQDASKLKSHRLLPSVIIWGAGINLTGIKADEELVWVGQGKTPVALMRTSANDPKGIFVGMKGGTPSSNHSHMDIGSFVMDANGERWTMDFGSQDYHSLESQGVKLWAMNQESQRWEVYRYNNFAHNTLTINNELQQVDGFAQITEFTDEPMFLSAQTDLSDIYKISVSSVNRGIAIKNKEYVVVRDEITASDKKAVIRWNMLTPAEVRVTGRKSAELLQNGKKLNLVVLEPATAELKTWSTEPSHSYDAPNPGTIFVGFEFILPAGYISSCLILLVPEGITIPEDPKIPQLKDWK